jgi:AcrR family transcriptional regulator
MPRSPARKRDRLIEAADKMVQRQGFEQTTLADIAKAAKVPLGNVYYYFKTKEAIGKALIAERAARYQSLREQWGELRDPKERLLAFVQMTLDNREMLADSGCPIGSLCQELHKEGGPLADQAASMFAEMLGWLERQLRDLGKGGESGELAVYVMSVLEGATLLTHSFHDPGYIVRQANRLKRWIRAL